MPKEKKLKLKFKGFLILYSIVLTIIMILFLIHVFDSLVKYEKNQNEKYIEKTLKNICQNNNCDIENLNNLEKSEFDTEESIANSLENFLEKADLKFEESLDSKEENPTYQIIANNTPILEVQLKSSKKINRLGLLSFYIWEKAEVKSKIEKGFYTYTITVPNNYTVYVNNKPLTKEQIKTGEQQEAFLEMAKYVEIPYNVTYEVENLYAEPEIKITNKEGENIDFEMHGNTIEKKLEFKKVDTLEQAQESIKEIPDILKFAENWSLFLTDDLKGTLHGFYQINEYLIDGSTLSKYAKSWATSVDITFTSKHTFDNPVFSNERLENFEIYSDEAFSAEVYLEKNMMIKGSKHKDVMHDKLYYVKTDKGWKLVNMQAVTEGNKDEGSSSNHTGV